MRLASIAAALFAAIAILAAPAFAQTSSEAAAIEEFKRGSASAAAGTNELTIQIMTSVINGQKLPKEWQPYSYFYRGQAYRRLGKFNEALSDYDKTVLLKPDLAPAFFETGLAYEGQEKYKQAVSAYDKALKISVDNVEYLFQRCIAKHQSGDLAGAREDCRKVVKIKPDHVDAWRKLGRVYEDQKQWAKAKECYNEILKLDPNDKDAKEGIDVATQCMKPGAICDGG